MKSKSNYDSVTWIGVGVSLLAFVLIFYFRPGVPKNLPQEAEQPAEQVAENGVAEQPAATANETVPGTPSVPPSVPVQGTQGQAASQLYGEVGMPHPKTETAVCRLVQQDGLKADVAEDGSGILSITLEQYLQELQKKPDDKAEPVKLANYDYPFLSLTTPGVLASQEAKSDGERTFLLTRMSEDGKLKVTESWTAMEGRPYELEYKVQISNLSEEAVTLQGYKVEGSAMPTSVTPERKAGRGESSGGLSIFTNGKTKDFNLKALAKVKPEERASLATTMCSWAGVHSKYFLMAFWLKDSPFAGIECAAVPSEYREGVETRPEARYHVRAILPTVSLEAGKTQEWTVTAYAGPKMFERLCDFGNGLESVMEMDRFFFWRPAWMRWISRILLRLLVKISQLFPPSIGYGMAVILLTILVKIIFWPLSHRSTVSMRKMQALKPELDEIRAKYKDDPQTMYRKQQELFKKNNVSQLGGCLPMLLQIPVFFALFNTFRNAIEMRHASFLWAYDLSMPDTLSFSPEALPIRPLALLMGLTMYFQQKMTPNPDPQQAKMMSFMTIFFMVLFYSMPSALTLYLSVSYVLGILQTYLTNKLVPPVAPAPQTTQK